MAKSEYTDLTYFMIYGYKLMKNSEVCGRIIPNGRLQEAYYESIRS